jgi:hypothetical protein
LVHRTNSFAFGEPFFAIKLANVLENHSELTPTTPDAGLMFPLFGVERRTNRKCLWIPYRREHDQPDR